MRAPHTAQTPKLKLQPGAKIEPEADALCAAALPTQPGMLSATEGPVTQDWQAFKASLTQSLKQMH